MRILLVSNMYPSTERPDYGVFVARLADALRERGNDVRDVVLQAGNRGPISTPRAYAGLTRQARAAAADHRPDVVYAHFLVPTGLVAIATGVPYVITAHGADVRNIRRSPVVSALTKQVLRRSAAVICVSDYVARQLSAPEDVTVEVIELGPIGWLRPAPPHDPGRVDVQHRRRRPRAQARMRRAGAELDHGHLPPAVGRGRGQPVERHP